MSEIERADVDLLIRIGTAPPGGDCYPVEAVVDARSQFFGGKLRLDRDALRAAVLDPGAYGTLLARALFSPPIQRAWDQAQARLQDLPAGHLRVRLTIDPGAGELESIRWERLMVRHRGQTLPVAVAMDTPFSRYTALELGPPLALAERPVRMLIALANPSGLVDRGLAPVDVELEVSGLWEALAPLADPANLAIALLPGRSGLSEALGQTLTAAGVEIFAGTTDLDALSALLPRFHLIHLVAHGAHRPGHQGEPGTSRLLLEATDGTLRPINDDALVGRWAVAAPLPRLIYLAACESATRAEGATQPFVGLAPKLVAAGVPAVVAMQDQVPMEYSSQITRRFFHALLTHGVVDRALNEARRELYEARSPDWSIPLLDMRLESGRLLVQDPVRAALEAIVEQSRSALAFREPPLPIEVARAGLEADPTTLAQLSRLGRSGGEIGEAAAGILLARDPPVQPFVILVGEDGSGIAWHLLRSFTGQVAERSLAGGPAVLPILIDPSPGTGKGTGSTSVDGGGIIGLLLTALERFWPGLTAWQLRGLWDGPSGPTFLVIVHQTHLLAESQRASLFGGLGELAKRERRHRFLVACDPGWIDDGSAAALPVSDYLVIKRPSFQRVADWLDRLPDPAGRLLLKALETRRLHDLAAMPWLVQHMLARCRLGDPPRSRSQVLDGYVTDALAGLPAGAALGPRARASLCSIARAMQLGRCRVLPLDRILEILDAVRGRWEYRLMEMLDCLLATRILNRAGSDGVQFAYPALQAFACADALLADPDLDALLDDITATLGRISRLRWWADTLVLLAGRIQDIDGLIAPILQGGGVGQGEPVLLAARCIEENGGERLAPLLREQVVSGLLYLTNADYEFRIPMRQQAIGALRRLQEPSAIPQLMRIALEPARTNWVGNRVVEYSGVRLAAIDALGAMGEATFAHVSREQSALAALLERWIAGDGDALEDALGQSEPRLRPIAAFLLGLLRTADATARLIRHFGRPNQDQALSWALADALTLVDPALCFALTDRPSEADPAQVIEDAILPFVDPGTGCPRDLPGESPKPTRDRRRQLAYLIGKVRPGAGWAGAYLEHCMFRLTDIALKGYVVQAYGDLMEFSQRPLLEQIAAGDLTGIPTGDDWTDDDRVWLRSVALETLARIGDAGTVQRLRATRGEAGRWPPALELVLYRTGEEIATRAWEQVPAGGRRRRSRSPP